MRKAPLEGGTKKAPLALYNLPDHYHLTVPPLFLRCRILAAHKVPVFVGDQDASRELQGSAERVYELPSSRR